MTSVGQDVEGAVQVFRCETLVKAPIESVFSFFSQAENLERITPRSLRFRILTPLPIEMRRGARIDYALRLFGLPIRWLSEITEFEPGRRFVDVQLRGPYRRWIHEHTFEPVGAGTLMTDTVRYEVGFGWIGRVVERMFVRRSVESIFAHRARVIASEFGQETYEA